MQENWSVTQLSANEIFLFCVVLTQEDLEFVKSAIFLNLIGLIIVPFAMHVFLKWITTARGKIHYLSTVARLYLSICFISRVNNCVSFTNYKFFVLFLGYAFSLCAWSAITSFEYFLRFWKNDLPSSYSKLHILFLFFVSIMFAVSLVSLYLYHLFLVFKNRSTLESFRTPIFRYGPDKRAYDLGKKKNWVQVFGGTRFTWLIPVSSW